MARQAVNVRIVPGSSTWTVPYGKFVGRAVDEGGCHVAVNGVLIGASGFGPLCANAGDVISSATVNANSAPFGLSGFVYDA